MIKKTISYEQALSKIASICSVSEKCEEDIRKKLQTWNICQNDIEKIITYLIKEKYIDEKRYVAAFVKEKINIAKWGKRKILFSLKNKNIDESIILNELNNIVDDDYNDKLIQILTSKLKSIKYKDANDAKVKLIRFALSRGYDYNTTIRIVENFSF